MYKKLAYLISAILFAPFIASAHEVYVLGTSMIVNAVAAPSPDPFTAFYTNRFQFFFWGFVSFVTVSTIFCMTLFHMFEKRVSPVLRKLKPYAPLIERVTLGLSVIAFAYNAALFGPELPFSPIYGAFTPLVQMVLYAAGTLITLGLFSRPATLAVGLVALFSIPVHGWYMLTYTAYFVVAVVIFIMGSGSYSLDSLLRRGRKDDLIERVRGHFERYEMLSLRLGFGFSVATAAFYAKFLHSNLALDVVTKYHLTQYFHFEPLFVVLGALIIETLIGVFIMLGLEIRWTALFFLFWLTLSLLYFGEAVWPHLALFGLNFMLLCHGYDRYSLEGWLFKHRALEPVL